MLLTEGQMSDFKGAALMLPALPKAKELLGDKAMMQTGSGTLSPSARRGVHPIKIQPQNPYRP